MKIGTIVIQVVIGGWLLIDVGVAKAAMQPDDPYGDAVVLAQSEEPGEEGMTNRVTLAEESGLKYPIMLISEFVLDGSNVVSQSAVVGDHIIVKLKEGKSQSDLETLNTQLGGTIRHALYAPSTYLVAFTNATLDTVDNAVAAYGAATNVVLYAEPDGIMHLNSFTPNDSRFTNLWGLHNTGQAGGTSDMDIDAPEAWDTATGTGVVVAVLDTGVDYTHPDLAANMWSNVNEIAGNSIDDDGNEFIDDIYGVDFYNNDSDPMDDNSHGTHCAGTIAAVGNNSIGVVGVAWNANLMAVKCMGAAGFGYTSDRLQGVAYIRSMVETGANVRVVSVSLGSGNSDSSERDDIQFLGSTNVLVVAAAGNSGYDLDDWGSSEFEYPAAYADNNVISVAAMDRSGAMPDWSNHGITQVDLSAPGESILSTVPGGGYGTKDGTSMATPHVAGVAALLFSHDPTLSTGRARRLLLASTTPLAAPIGGRTVTDGCVNAARALEMLDAVAMPTFDPEPGFFDTNAVQVTMTTETPGAAIYFTTNGLAPDATSSLYTGLVTVAMGTILKARAYATGITNSPVESGCYSWSRRRVLRWGLSLDPGWTTNGLWEYGVPSGGPNSGVTGANVYGYNLDGNYEQGITRSLTTTAIDCTGLTQTELRFQRWFKQKFGRSSIQISTNGTDWVDVWTVSDADFYYCADDTSWKLRTYDISKIADGQPAVYLRWVMGPTDASLSTAKGWNIDDVEIWSSKDPATVTNSEPFWAF
jgi:subtilisin family serine protease